MYHNCKKILSSFVDDDCFLPKKGMVMLSIVKEKQIYGRLSLKVQRDFVYLDQAVDHSLSVHLIYKRNIKRIMSDEHKMIIDIELDFGVINLEFFEKESFDLILNDLNLINSDDSDLNGYMRKKYSKRSEENRRRKKQTTSTIYKKKF